MSELLPTNMILSVAPELRDAPLYVCPTPAERLPLGAAAAVLPLDPLWKSRLVAAGQWRGVGRLIVVSDSLLTLPGDYLLGCLAHELAHLLPATTPVLIGETIPDAVSLCAMLEHRDAGRSVDEWPGASAAHHGPAFVRRLLHLRWRLGQLGHVLPFDALGVYHGPSHVSLLARWLGDEPQRQRYLAFSEIESIPAPAAFAAAWET